MRRLLMLGGAVSVLLALSACAPSGSPVTETNSPTSEVSSSPQPIVFNQELHDELIAMLERDQASRMGEVVEESDYTRTERLKEIIDEYGWPTIGLVGEDGEDAAWAIAQHSDLDPEFQEFALGLLGDAVDAGQASPGNYAYLYDRIAAAKREPQLYGTQVGCIDGKPVAATDIEDEENLEERRAEAGLAPYSDYLLEMEPICAEVQ